MPGNLAPPQFGCRQCIIACRIPIIMRMTSSPTYLPHHPPKSLSTLSLLIPLNLPEPAQRLQLPIPKLDARATDDARVERERRPHGLLCLRRGVEPQREVVAVVMAQLVSRHGVREGEDAPVSDRADHAALSEDQLAGCEDDSREGGGSVGADDGVCYVWRFAI